MDVLPCKCWVVVAETGNRTPFLATHQRVEPSLPNSRKASLKDLLAKATEGDTCFYLGTFDAFAELDIGINEVRLSLNNHKENLLTFLVTVAWAREVQEQQGFMWLTFTSKDVRLEQLEHFSEEEIKRAYEEHLIDILAVGVGKPKENKL
jgi:hypothetical protein